MTTKSQLKVLQNSSSALGKQELGKHAHRYFIYEDMTLID